MMVIPSEKDITYIQEHIKDIRKSLGLSQGDLAKLVGISRITINRLENNHCYMTLQQYNAVMYVVTKLIKEKGDLE